MSADELERLRAQLLESSARLRDTGDRHAQLLAALKQEVATLQTALPSLQELREAPLDAQRGSRVDLALNSVNGSVRRLDALVLNDGQEPRHAAVAAPKRRQLHLLLVEDSPTNRAVALAMLKSSPLVVDTVENGMQAIEQLRRVQYDLVLMDVAMPVMGGLDATRAIRALDGPMARVPVIAMTANALASDEARCREAGMDDYLTKPIERANLLATLTRWLGPLDDPRPAIDETIVARLLQEVEPGALNRLLGVFLDEAQNRATRIRDAVARLDAAEAIAQIEHESHALKGSAQTFGAAALAARALVIENAIRARALDRVRSEVVGLAEMVRDADNAYRARGYYEGP